MKNLDIKKVCLTKDNLEKIYKIDRSFYKLDISWYLDRYNENNSAYVLVDNEKYVGYILSIPIKESLYKALYDGVLIDDTNINPNMFIKESKYYYIVSCVILTDYKNKGYGSKLMEYVIKDNVGKYISLSLSDDGFQLLNKYLPNKKCIYKNIFVFNN